MEHHIGGQEGVDDRAATGPTAGHQNIAILFLLLYHLDDPLCHEDVHPRQYVLPVKLLRNQGDDLQLSEHHAGAVDVTGSGTLYSFRKPLPNIITFGYRAWFAKREKMRLNQLEELLCLLERRHFPHHPRCYIFMQLHTDYHPVSKNHPACSLSKTGATGRMLFNTNRAFRSGQGR